MSCTFYRTNRNEALPWTLLLLYDNPRPSPGLPSAKQGTNTAPKDSVCTKDPPPVRELAPGCPRGKSSPLSLTSSLEEQKEGEQEGAESPLHPG